MNRVWAEGPVVVTDAPNGVVAVAVSTTAEGAGRLAVGWNLALDLLAMDAGEGRSAAALRHDIECLKSVVRAQASW